MYKVSYDEIVKGHEIKKHSVFNEAPANLNNDNLNVKIILNGIV